MSSCRSRRSSCLAGKLRGITIVSLVLGGPIAAWHPAAARPPENADLSLAFWFEDLMQPVTGLPCCSISDCRRTQSRIMDSHYEALIEGKWLPVPPDKVLERTDNPTGQAVVCWLPWTGILCFVKAPES
jgi:hypothetical protein